MLRIEDKSVYLACGHTDMRKSINGLTLLVQSSFELDPFEKSIFVFCNRTRNRLKILEWDGDGFWLHLKRLEQGHFKWPTEGETKTMTITDDELSHLLGSTRLEQKLRRKELIGRIVC